MKQLTLAETSNQKPNLSSPNGGKTVVVTPQEKERHFLATPTSQELAKDPDPSTAIVPNKLDFSYPAILSKVYTLKKFAAISKTASHSMFKGTASLSNWLSEFASVWDDPAERYNLPMEMGDGERTGYLAQLGFPNFSTAI